MSRYLTLRRVDLRTTVLRVCLDRCQQSSGYALPGAGEDYIASLREAWACKAVTQVRDRSSACGRETSLIARVVRAFGCNPGRQKGQAVTSGLWGQILREYVLYSCR